MQNSNKTEPFKITATEAAAIKAALKKKQIITKTGEKVGSSPEEALDQVYRTLGAKYGVKPESIFHYFKTEDGEVPYNYITGEPVGQVFAAEVNQPADTSRMPEPSDFPEHVPGTPLGFSPDLPGGPEDDLPAALSSTVPVTITVDRAEEKHDDFEYMDEQSIILPFVLEPGEKPWLAKFEKMELEVVNILKLCKDQPVTDVATRDTATGMVSNASQLAKRVESKMKLLAQPLKDDIAVITAVGKKLFNPLDESIRDLKKKITDFNVKAEKERQAEILRLAEEKRLQDEAAQKEIERVNKLKAAKEKFITTMDDEINAIQNLVQLDAYVTKMKAWNPKAEYWQEMLQDIVKERDNCIARAEGRRKVCQQLEDQQKKTQAAQQQGQAQAAQALLDQRKAEDKLKAQQLKDQEDKEKRRQEQEALETNAKFTVTTAVDQLGWPKNKIGDELEQIFQLFGSYVQAAAQFERMVKGSSDRLSKVNEALALEASKAKNMRTIWKARITDPNKVPRDYMVVDMVKINNLLTSFKEEILAGNFKVEGVEFYPETTTVAEKAK